MTSTYREPVWERARGRWHGILTGLGVDANYLTGKAGPCPICRDGKDRFVFDNKGGDGSWLCRHCGAGMGTEFVKRFKGVEFKEASRLIDEQIGTAPFFPAKPTTNTGPDLKLIGRLWDAARPPSAGNPVHAYFESRLGHFDLPDDIRYLKRCRRGPGDYHPAMLAMVRDQHGNPCQLHRTFLDEHGSHAPVDPVRKLMRGQLPAGGAVRLAEPDDVLGVAEGIETALAATKLFNVPVWACLTAKRLETWEPPEGVGHVIIFADKDRSFTGLRAAAILAHRIADRVSVEIKEPPHMGDWNDQLQRELQGASA